MSLIEQIQSAQQQAKRFDQRRLVVLSGDQEWCISQLATIENELQQPSFNQAIWLGEDVPQILSGIPFNSVKPTKANAWLGTSTDLIVADLFAGFHPDALAAISGTLSGGSLLLLLIPAFDQWPNYEDPDYQRMLVYPQTVSSIQGRFVNWIAKTLHEAPQALIVTENEPLSVTNAEAIFNQASDQQLNQAQTQTQTVDKTTDKLLRLNEQEELVNTLVKCVNNQQAVMVVRGDRGRGKSAALGLTAAELMSQRDGIRICVTAPRPDAVLTFFQFAKQTLNINEKPQPLKVSKGKSELWFAAPDELIRHQPQADLLIVDEAAAIPIFMLEALRAKYPQIIFASTVHGYEGTGRGFDLRFAKVLDKKSPKWQQWTLTHPIRWSDNDPVEQWINQAFLLDLEVQLLDSLSNLSVNESGIRPVTQDELLAKPDLLKQIYGLLIQAHYRTTPGDLRDLLDGNLSLWIQTLNVEGKETVVGVLLLAKEGELPDDLSQEIWAGKRRPRGHLVPQYLTAQAGFIEAAKLSYLRVVRIAVHPDLQSQGLGSLLLAELDRIAEQEGVNAVAAMFAASADLMRFWRENGFQALRLGVSRDSSSGSYTALVAKPVKEKNDLFLRMGEDFLQQLQQQLGNVWQDLEPELLIEMINRTPPLSQSEKSLKDVESFVLAHRGLDQVRSVMGVYLFTELQRLPLDQWHSDWVLMVRFLLQGEDAASVIQSAKLQGLKQLHALIKARLSQNLN